MAPRPIELEQLERVLDADFGGRLALQNHGNAVEKRRNFLSRSQAGFLIHKLTSCGLDEAAASVLDASGDGGIDAVYIDQPKGTLWLVQSKYIESGDGEPDLGGLAKFLLGIDNLLSARHETFQTNPGWKAKLPSVKKALADDSIRIRALIVYSSFRLMSEDRRVAVEKLLDKYGDREYLQISSYGLESLHRFLTAGITPQGVDNVGLEILMPSRVRTPYETLTGQVKATQLLALYEAHREALVASNIRKYKGSTDVNEEIARTAFESPERFFYLNNGLTAFCRRWSLNYEDRSSTQRQRVIAHGFSVVNGAQTLGSLVKGLQKPGSKPDDCLVPIKLISLAGSPEDADLAKTITRSTNYQNTIGPRDFVALQELQGQIADTLALEGITYHYKDAEDTPLSDQGNLTFDEAVIALACADRDPSCDLVARVLANKKSLYSFEVAYPERDDYTTRYQRLFPPTLSARRLWRAVQAYRQVFQQLTHDARHAPGTRKAFLENVRPLVLSLIFLRLGPELKDGMMLSAQEESHIREKATEFAELMWNVAANRGFVAGQTPPEGAVFPDAPRHFRSVFCSAGDCQNIRAGALAVLERSPARSRPRTNAEAATS